MSYRCVICNRVVSAGQRCIKMVTERREKHYPFRPKVNPGFVLKRGELKRSNKISDRVDDPGGVGVETVKEIPVCEKCQADKS